jgi:phosphohistidine phosphatase
MKKLYLLRHAKSSWDDASLADFDRPLNDRGLRTAPLMGRLMREKKFVPELVLASPAERASTTATLVRAAAGFGPEIRHDDRIYEASPGTLLQIAAGLDDEYGSVMLVGHNPGMEGFVRLLTDSIEPMPTAALAVIDLDISRWSDVGAGAGRLRAVFRPKTEFR